MLQIMKEKKDNNSLWHCLRCDKDIIGYSFNSKRDSNIEVCYECKKEEEIFDDVILKIQFPYKHDETMTRLREDERKWLTKLKR